jgi:hypothetical protein
VSSTPEALKFIQKFGAPIQAKNRRVHLLAYREQQVAAEAERERLRTIRNQRLARLQERSLAS